ncbi:YeeE/YedE family protein [Tepidamorphus sp. 3E244]|uniref:YeeE/YedE family protein n=1 Tax=Tepidamorphus sp. 3E244 TaxID=3385498 RepID=UPI0038FC31E0
MIVTDWLIDRLGEGGTAALFGLIAGIVFGYAAQRSRFCLRAAVIEFVHGHMGERVAVWLLVFTGAVFFTQALWWGGLIDITQVRQLAATGSLSGALIGGLLFGTGMILTRGCASRLLVLSATGNLRALLSGLVFAVTAQASLRGQLAPLREFLASLWIISGTDMRHALNLLGIGESFGPLIAAAWFVLALALAWRLRLNQVFVAGSLGVAGAVALGWLLTWTLSQHAFEPVAVKSMTFSGPSADVLMFVLNPPGDALDFDIGLVPGVFAGSFLAAWFARELKLQGFDGAAAMRRYVAGAMLMGFGGMLAGGCAVGAGITGGSVFAVTAWVTLAAMWAGAGLTDHLVDGQPRRKPNSDVVSVRS